MQATVPSIQPAKAKTAGTQKAAGSPPAKAPAKAVRPAPAAGDRMPRGLPLIGRLSVTRQFQILLVLLVFCLALAAFYVYVNNRQAAQNAIYISTATEMQMLSQRIANSAQQAAQGSPVGFDQLAAGRDQFITDHDLLADGGKRLGVTVAPSSEEAQSQLREAAILWRTVQGDINLLVSQRDNLIELRNMESRIEKSAPQIAQLAKELATAAAQAGENARVVSYVRSLQADAVNSDFLSALRILSTDNPNAEAAAQFGKNTQQFQRALGALVAEPRDASTPAIANESVRRKAAELNDAFAPFASSVQTIVSNLQGLAVAKQTGRDIFSASEDLFKVPGQLVQVYQRETQRLVYYIGGAVAASLLALVFLMLLGKVFLDDARRRALQSEQQNRRNQDAILRLLDEMGKVADGDLTVQAKVTEDVTGAIADSINYTIEELRRLVSGITKAAAQVGAATGEAQGVTAQLLQATQKQSGEIQGTGQSVLKMAQSFNEVSASAMQSVNVANSSLSAAEKGAQAVQNAVRGMNNIREQIQETSKRIKRLGESSQEIGEIVQLITDITEQTNVLALNAAIQAASAGEAGRGFTVVAEEVQRLAERSAEATKHISAIVKSIQSDTQDAVEAMEHSTQGVVVETKVVDEAGQALHEIERISKELAKLITSISGSAQDQAAAATKVATNMKAILDVTQMTTEGTKKTAASAAELNALANELKNSVSGFKLA